MATGKEIRIEAYRPEGAGDWDAFVEGSNNGTLFHKQSFLAYHGPGRAQGFRHLLFYRGDRLAAVLPMGVGREGAMATARSPEGASFGGLVTAGAEYAEHRDLVEALVEYLRQHGIGRMTLTPPPAAYHLRPDGGMEFCLLRAGFTLAARNLCQAVDLAALAGRDPLESYTYACNKQVRKALREGIEVRPTRDWEAFHPVLEENRRKHGVKPTHSLEDLRRLDALVPEALHLFGAFRGETLIGGVLCFAANPRLLLNFYTCHREEDAGTGVSNLLNHEAITWARDRGFRTYDFGTSSLAMEPNEGLIRFKESFGGGSLLRDTYIWEANLPSRVAPSPSLGA